MSSFSFHRETLSNSTTLRKARTFLLRSTTPHPKKSNKPRKDNRNKKVSRMESKLPAITTRMATASKVVNMEMNSKTMEKNKIMEKRALKNTDLKVNTVKKVNKLMDRSPVWNEVNHKTTKHISKHSRLFSINFLTFKISQDN